ncbi:uncharacterized protein LOC119673405 [Teleopsis dalmanni]|uniref:uncharacterized protein LOC119670385 n=1 Tax=Teleopsis dalmanni TaxID=139649 RepID=UPI0018CD9478|nr:uncharacterized protein LOC119670385 [Teleopsis dalmanni]XP_037940603.1 uncharacterized protein LOC119673405 [Teleopsis dalmanni]
MHFLQICLLFLVGAITSTNSLYSRQSHRYSDINFSFRKTSRDLLSDPSMSPNGLGGGIGDVGPKCNYENMELNIGEKYQPPNSCLEISCAPGGVTRYGNCEPINVPSNCKMGLMDLSRPFPYCCVRELICLK